MDPSLAVLDGGFDAALLDVAEEGMDPLFSPQHLDAATIENGLQASAPFTPPSSPPELGLEAHTDSSLFPLLGDIVPHDPIDLDDVGNLPQVKRENAPIAATSQPMKKRRRRRVDPSRMSPEELQEHLIKKQQRMLKNRESASLSRKKKKEYLESLESKVKQQEDEIKSLKEQVRALEAENASLRSRAGMPPSPAASSPTATTAVAATCLMACLLCFAFVARPATPSTSLSMPVISTHSLGRTLKSFDVSLVRAQDQPKLIEAASTSHALQPLGHPIGPVERSQPSRIPLSDAQVRTFLRQHEKKVMQHINSNTTRSDNAEEAPITQHSTALATSTGNAHLIEGEPPMYRIADDMRPTMIHSIRRQSDTSYIFCTQVQVAAASEPGQERLLSLVMPTPSIDGQDDTDPASNASTVNMMQIDCRVAATRVFSVHRNATAGVPVV